MLFEFYKLQYAGFSPIPISEYIQTPELCHIHSLHNFDWRNMYVLMQSKACLLKRKPVDH